MFYHIFKHDQWVNYFFPSKLEYKGCYINFTLLNIFSMKNEVYMCNISMERKFCRLHDGIKWIRLHNLMNHNSTVLNITLLGHIGRYQKVKLLTTFL